MVKSPVLDTNLKIAYFSEPDTPPPPSPLTPCTHTHLEDEWSGNLAKCLYNKEELGEEVLNILYSF